jgi:hypothetical protein
MLLMPMTYCNLVDAFEEENSNMLDDSNITNQHNENSGHGIIDTLNRNTCGTIFNKIIISNVQLSL